MADAVKTNSGIGERVRVNGPVVFLVATIALLIGLAPVILTLISDQRVLYFVGYFVACAAVAAVWYLRPGKFLTYATYSPAAWEFLLAGLGGLSSWAVIGLYWFGGQVVFYWITQIVRLDISGLSFWLSVCLGLPFGAVIASINVQTILRQLYPDAAGVRSPIYRRTLLFYQRLTQGSPQDLLTLALYIGGFVTVAFLIYGLSLLLPPAVLAPRQSLYFLLQIVLFAIGSPLAGVERPEDTDAVGAIQRLLRAAGYTVIPAPRTGDPTIDPLLLNLDIFAYNDDRGLAINIETASKPMEQVVFSLPLAARALSRAGRTFGHTPAKVECVLVRIGGDQDDSVKEIAREKSVSIWNCIPDQTTLNKILRTTDQDVLRKTAQDCLELPTRSATGHAPAGAPTSPEGP